MSGCRAGGRSTGHGTGAANSAANRDKQVSIGGRAAIVESHLPDPALKEFAAVGNQVPSGTTVSRLVDADASFGVAGGVLFTGARIESVTGRIAWIDQ